ncbi:het-domain-containing protein [Diplodia corticola]|uniref:Het-domain-containing protein n=1 Tax=Diplodia corticola TaxID=236234 RepID=A0A1J9RLP2_9PEZI|nr:het-domain-containing protein [Diplodia corticola]OJD29431.1 het-domain-containing protein [Diplodia corticola]
MENPFTLVEYSREELCPACRDLPPVKHLPSYEHVLHDNFNSFLSCPCLFCVWLQKAQKADLTSRDRDRLIKENPAVCLFGNLHATPQTINLGNQLSDLPEVYLHLFADPRRLPKAGRDPFPDTRSDQAFEAINGWIENCACNHESCKPPDDTLLPSYIVDVGSSGHGCCRLLVTGGQQKGRYAALSYVWGVSLQDQPVYLSKESQPRLTHEIPEDKLPPTIKDAVLATRKLGIRYLWIDALCIPQDDEAVKTAEIAKMHRIFGDAFVTIQAARAKSVKEGFLHQMPPPSDLPHQKLRYDGVDDPDPGFVYMRAAPVSTQEGPVGTRAWCFEEGVLSRRVLQYAKERITYECLAGRKSDDGSWRPRGTYTASGPGFFSPASWHQGSPISNDKKVKDPRLDVLRAWYMCLDNWYTPRFLTKKRDRLPAIAGVARRIQDRVGGGFLAGLWESDMIWGLLWSSRRLIGVKFLNKDIEKEWKERWGAQTLMVRPQGDARAPSWSWASLDGPTFHPTPRRWSGKHWSVAEILHYPVAAVGNTLGKLDDDRLILSAPVRRGHVVLDGERNTELQLQVRSSPQQEIKALLDEASESFIALGKFDIEKNLPQTVWCILILNSMGLILVPHGGNERTFRRVGTFDPVVPWETESKMEICIR